LFIPLIPLGSAGEYVECGQCKGTFIPRVLDSSKGTNNEKFLAIYEKAIRHSMVKIMLADGIIDAQEKVMVRQIINKFGKNDLTEHELDNYIKEVQKTNEDVTTYLKIIGPSLNEHGKEIIIKCALAVAASDGNIDDSEIDLINKMSSAMQMSPSHLRGIISEMSEYKSTQ